MKRNARLWVGGTLLLIILFNYMVIGVPMFKRASSLENKSKAMLISQVKSGKVLKNSEDEFILEILKREKISLERRILLLNCVAVSLAIGIASWIVFGLITRNRKRQ